MLSGGNACHHADYKSMKLYIDISKAAKREAISLMGKAFDTR